MSFVKGVLVGVGVGLLIAPMKGEELRQRLRERYAELQTALPDQEQLQRTGQQVAAGLSQTSTTAKNAAQQVASRAQQTASTVSDLAQQSARKMKPTGQNIANTIKKAPPWPRQGKQATTTPDEEEAVILVEPIVPGDEVGRSTSEFS